MSVQDPAAARESKAPEPVDLERLQPEDELIAEARNIDAPLPPDMPPRMAAVIETVDAFSARCGQVVSWITPIIFLVMVWEIFLRYAFTAPTLWAYDVSRMLYGALFMVGSGYALLRGVHIRADFLYRNWSPRVQGSIDLALYLILYFPGLLFFLWTASEFFLEAMGRGERLDDTAWRPYVAPVRFALWLGVLLLLVQGVSEALKAYYAATRGKWPR